MADVAIPTLASLDWGNLPSWVGALGSTAAFGLGTRIYWRDSRDRRREQASKIFGYLADDGEKWQYGLGNTSDQPVYNLLAQFVNTETGMPLADETLRWPSLEPGDYYAYLTTAELRKALNEVTNSPSGPPAMVHPPVALVISFVDAAGRRWRREHDGQLGSHKARTRPAT